MNKRRRVIRRAISIVMLAVALGFGAAQPGASHRARTGRADPLPSWNDGAAKRGIIDFVTRVTREGGAAYFHEAGKKAVLELFVATETGMDQERFAAEARRFLEKWRNPKLDRPFTELAYRPMIELLDYLRRSGFAPQIYGIPIDQIIGTELKLESRMEGDRLVVWRLPEIETINDKEGKPVGIDRQIGKRPIFVAGNVGNYGDIAMMQYSKSRRGPSFQLLINHDDAAREFAYGEKDNASLNAAKKYGFAVVSVKNDWKTVFVAGQAAAAK